MNDNEITNIAEVHIDLGVLLDVVDVRVHAGNDKAQCEEC